MSEVVDNHTQTDPAHPSSSSSTPDHQQYYVAKSFLAGGLSGMCAKTTTAPLDRLKILLQVGHTHYKHYGIFRGFCAIHQREGILGYYKGNGAMMVRIFPYAAIQFMSYEQYKRLLRPYFNAKTHTSKLAAGSLTGLTAVTFTYPLDMVRARLAFQVHERRYRSIWHTLVTIPRQEGGLIALYRGFSSSILGMVPYAGVAFYSYEVIKSFLMENPFVNKFTVKPSLDGSGTVVLNISANLFCGGMAGASSQTVSYPLDVARRRMQLEGMVSSSPKYRSVVATLGHVYRTSGVAKGLYRGMSINYIRAMPQVAVSFTAYELLKQLFGISRPL